jgi:hypothetical protein
MKKCSTSLAINDIQIKTTLKFNFTTVRMAIIKKKQTLTNTEEDVEEKEALHAVDGNIN